MEKEYSFKKAHYQAQGLLYDIFKLLGVSNSDFPETAGTPERIINMWANEFFANVGKEFDDLYLDANTREVKEIIHFPNIRFTSCCAHHFLPFSGYAHLLYIPKKWLIGASKPSRIIEHYSKRPQLQENLSNDIVDFFHSKVDPYGTMLVMYGIHGCMSCRGVMQYESGMGTSAVRGGFLSEPELEVKGYELIKLSKGMI